MIEPIEYSKIRNGGAMLNVKVSDNPNRYVRARMDDQGFTHLVCECEVFARKLWCAHVESVSMDDSLMANQTPEWSPCIVIFRNPGWLIIPVLVVPPEVGTEFDFCRLDVLWGSPKKVGNEYEAGGGETIGFVGRYDRRKAIRSMVLEWLPSLIYRAEARTCTSNLHSSGDSIIERIGVIEQYALVDDPIRRKILTEAYNILDTGKCVACTTASIIPF